MELAEIAEDRSKIALVDLLRLLVLKDTQAEYILSRHWDLLQVCIFGYLSAQDLKDKEAKVIQNYHLASLKFLANIFQTAQGKSIMQSVDKSIELIDFCTKSFSSCNDKIVYHAAMVLFNEMLCFESDAKKSLQPALEKAMSQIGKALASLDMVDQDTLKALLLCECRILYKNSGVTAWADDNKASFLQTHTEVRMRTQH